VKKILQLCEVDRYAKGVVPCPQGNPQEECDWMYNDNYACVIISDNVMHNQMTHIGWTSLEAVHEMESYQAAISVVHNIFESIADDKTNIMTISQT
jgi:hypothetical protein